MTEPIHILIVDDHTLFRNGLRALLNSLPDVVLMDIQMPGINGIEATRQMVRTSPHVGIVVVTMFEDNDSVLAAMRAGARGYVLKGADQEEMLRAIRAVARGEALFGAAVAVRLQSFFSAPRTAAPPEAFPNLTEREREVLELLAQGGNNADIARKLTISMKTVRNHVSNILSKLQGWIERRPLSLLVRQVWVRRAGEIANDSYLTWTSQSQFSTRIARMTRMDANICEIRVIRVRK